MSEAFTPQLLPVKSKIVSFRLPELFRPSRGHTAYRGLHVSRRPNGTTGEPAA